MKVRVIKNSDGFYDVVNRPPLKSQDQIIGCQHLTEESARKAVRIILADPKQWPIT